MIYHERRMATTTTPLYHATITITIDDSCHHQRRQGLVPQVNGWFFGDFSILLTSVIIVEPWHYHHHHHRHSATRQPRRWWQPTTTTEGSRWRQFHGTQWRRLWARDAASTTMMAPNDDDWGLRCDTSQPSACFFSYLFFYFTTNIIRVDNNNILCMKIESIILRL
jgi:hypothetical protein